MNRFVSQFRQEWAEAYLERARSRPKWTTDQADLQVGQAVVVVRENEKRNRWPLARVVERIRGSDHRVRDVWVQEIGQKISVRKRRSTKELIPVEYFFEEVLL